LAVEHAATTFPHMSEVVALRAGLPSDSAPRAGGADPAATTTREFASRLLRVPLLGKLAGANLLIVLAALVSVAAEAELHRPASAVSILGMALAVSLVVNVLLVHIALRPLVDLETVAARVSGGDLAARVAASPLADRDMARVGQTLNALLDRLTEDRASARRLAAQVISAQDDERARVARELHDSTAQILTAVMLQLGVAARESGSEALDARLATVRALTAEALEEVRSMAHTMHPRVLDDLGLLAALEWLARQTTNEDSLEVLVRGEADAGRIPAPLASVLYRVAQEALRNVARHANASHATVRLIVQTESARLEIEDDGTGFDLRQAEERRPGMGLFSIRERVALVDGRVTIQSAPGEGTRIVALIPLPTD
jgi:signal transduction histidine kinase